MTPWEKHSPISVACGKHVPCLICPISISFVSQSVADVLSTKL
jgi:hypothetical protein